MAGFAAADAPSHAAIVGSFHHWDDIDVHIHGASIRTSGHGFAGIERKRLLNILQERAAQLGVEQTFQHEVRDEAEFADADLLITAETASTVVCDSSTHLRSSPMSMCASAASSGSARRSVFLPSPSHSSRPSTAGFRFRAYQFSSELSTVIVETREETWLAHGLDRATTDESIAFAEQLFGKYLGGARLLGNTRRLRGSAWLNFNRVLCRRWFTRNIVLISDAAHTAHFSIGSGTKLAMEDAIALSREITRGGDVSGALQHYQEERELEH